jgi:hypothetical protein
LVAQKFRPRRCRRCRNLFVFVAAAASPVTIVLAAAASRRAALLAASAFRVTIAVGIAATNCCATRLSHFFFVSEVIARGRYAAACSRERTSGRVAKYFFPFALRKPPKHFFATRSAVELREKFAHKLIRDSHLSPPDGTEKGTGKVGVACTQQNRQQQQQGDCDPRGRGEIRGFVCFISGAVAGVAPDRLIVFALCIFLLCLASLFVVDAHRSPGRIRGARESLGVAVKSSATAASCLSACCIIIITIIIVVVGTGAGAGRVVGVGGQEQAQDQEPKGQGQGRQGSGRSTVGRWRRRRW